MITARVATHRPSAQLAVVVASGHLWTPVGREGGSGTRDTLAAALAAVLGTGTVQARAALSLSTIAAVRAAVLASAASAVISELGVADEPAAGWLIEIRTPELDLRWALHVIWTCGWS